MAKQGGGFFGELVAGVLGGVITAAVLWLAGAFSSELSKAELQGVANNLQNSEEFKDILVDSLKEDPAFKGPKGDAATGVDTAQAIANDEELRTQLVAELSKSIEGQVNVAPAARFEQRIKGQDVSASTGVPIGTVIDFDKEWYNTHPSVGRNSPWAYKVPKDGYYTVTACAACDQLGGALALGLCVNEKSDNKRPTVFLAQLTEYKSGTMIGGTADAELREGDLVDVRVYAGGVTVSDLAAIGTTHFSIHYVRPLRK